MFNRKLAIAGGGSIGVAFAVVFAQSHETVCLYEPSEQRRKFIPEDIASRLAALASYGLLEESEETVASRITIHTELGEAVAGAQLVQECVPENVELKQQVIATLAGLTSKNCVIASSTSFIPSSESAANTGVEDRALVAHPGNPPYAIPIIELVPNPNTRPAILDLAEQIYSEAGLSPVRVEQEIEGFIFNRIQGAVLREAYSLVRDGIASVEDIDTVVRDGLGRRWTFMGPFETVDLNTRGGIASHAQKMGPSYYRMGRSRGDVSKWTPELIANVETQRRALLPLEEWDRRVAWRDNQLLRRLCPANDGKN